MGTYRDVEVRLTPQTGRLLGEFAREGHHMPLSGLAETDVARLIESSLGFAAPDTLVAALHRATEGNPFFLDEVLRLLASEGRGEECVELAAGGLRAAAARWGHHAAPPLCAAAARRCAKRGP